MFIGTSELPLITVITADENWRRNSKLQPLTGSRFEIKFILARIHDSNEIPTAILMYSGGQARGNKERLVRILSDVWVR